MRVLMDITLPVKKFNKLMADGSAGKKMDAILSDIKPESVYFLERDGKRAATLIVDVTDPSQIPSFAEPWFLQFNAEVKVHLTMSPEDLQKAGLDELAKKWIS